MVAIRDAVKVSIENLRELFAGEIMPDLRLEEVNLSEDGKKWEVTVSYVNPDFDREMEGRSRGNNGLHFFIGDDKKVPLRLYKTVSIGAENGNLLGIRNDWEMFEV